MIKVIDEINSIELDNYTLIVPSNKELFYKEKFINKNYEIYNIKNFLLSIYDKNEKLINDNISYIIMYNAFNNIKDTLSYYKDTFSYSFIKDLVNTYNLYYDFDLVDNEKNNDLNIIFKEYEKNLLDNAFISNNMLYRYVISNYKFDGNYVFLDVNNLSNKDIKLIKKMASTSNVLLNIDNLNNNHINEKLYELGISYKNKEISFKDKEYSFKAFNDLKDEVSFINNDISKKIMEKNSYNDIIIVSPFINEYNKYLDLYLDHPFTSNKEEGVLTSRFITLFCDMLKGDFSCAKFIEILKLGVFDIDNKLIDKLDNYIYSWGLDDESFYKTFNYNPNGNKNNFSSKDKEDLKVLNSAKDSIINPIKYLLENIINSNKTDILKNIYIYLKEENIIDNLFSKDKIGVNNLISALENINDYAPCNLSLKEVIELLSNMKLSTIKRINNQNMIEVKDIKDAFYDDKKIIYLVGMSLSNMPLNYKFNTLITKDDITKETLINILKETNDMSYYYFSKALDNKEVYITYPKLSDDLRLEEKSSYLNDLNLCEIKDDEVYNKNELLKRYATLLSEDKVGKIEQEEFIKINKSNEHKLNHKLDKEVVEKLYDNNLSLTPSSIEVYAKCPFYHFCLYGLKLKVKEKYTFDNREVGTFIHYVLENIIKNDINEIDMNNIKDYVYKYSKSYLEDNNKIINNASLYLIKSLSDNVTHVIKNIVNEFNISKFKPTYFEFRINDGDIIKPLKIKLDNKTLNVSGIVDRIDLYKEDSHYHYRIIDYKTGDKKFRLDDVLDGLNLQMIVYLLAIKESDYNNIPEGILYYPALLKEKTSSRSLSDIEKEESIKDRLKMNGIVSNSFLDNLEEEKKYIKMTVRDKVDEEKIFDTNGIDLIFNSVKNTLKKIGNSIYSGDISVNPIGDRNDACSYCNFKSICKFDDVLDKKRKPLNYKNKEVFSMLEGDKNA